MDLTVQIPGLTICGVTQPASVLSCHIQRMLARKPLKRKWCAHPSTLCLSHIRCLSACPIAADIVHFERLPWGCHEHLTLSILLSSWRLLFWGEPPSKNCLGPALLSFWDEAQSRWCGLRGVGRIFSILANLPLWFSSLAAFHVCSWALFIIKNIAHVWMCLCHCACLCVLQPYSRHFFFCLLKGSHSASQLCFDGSGGCETF